MPTNTTINQIMTKGVFSVEIDDKVLKADEIMRDQHVKHVPVLENRKFVGLISERSLREYSLKQLYDYDEPMNESARNRIIDFREIMEKDVHLVYPEDSVLKAVELMIKKKYDCLPVVDWNKNLIGLLTHTDILLFFRSKLEEQSDK